MASQPIIFLSDFGDSDEFAGVCRTLIERRSPGTPVIDLAHGIPAGNVRRGALALAAAVHYAPEPAVWLAVVDPGVGTKRRALALRAGDSHLVGPDNGLLMLAAEELGGVDQAIEISHTPIRLEPTSSTFHGRDIFTPVAAELANGGSVASLGELLDPAGLRRLEMPRPRVEPGRLEAHVLYADGYGNLILDVTTTDLRRADLDSAATLALGSAGHSYKVQRGATFSDAGWELVLYDDSSGRLGLALAGASAAELLAAGRNRSLTIEAWS